MVHCQVVVITGASAGIARATARAFGARGAQVGLVARGRAGLDGAAKDVENAGGNALAIPTDVADYEQVEAAAGQVEDNFGPIDVWINVAFTSVFAPFHEIKPEEFRRVTEVSYLGFVYGTMAALTRMRSRDRGTIVQVGSALGERSIPLQSAYCGAKHAINGFTESLRTELMHEGSNVHVTVVQMPAVNTPQFSWVLSRLPCHRSRCHRSTNPRWPRVAWCSRPITRSASSTGWARAPWAPSWGRGSPRRSWTAIWPGPATNPSRPGRRWGQTVRTTCGSPSMAGTGMTTAPMGYSMTEPIAAPRSCGSPTTPGCSRPPRWPRPA
jgi:NAD(P)-dependent dehydrogenase (short-subunit alcohol dehydrogenase family)